jgi:hypothetical protein
VAVQSRIDSSTFVMRLSKPKPHHINDLPVPFEIPSEDATRNANFGIEGEPAMASFVRYLNPTASEERKRTLLHSRVLRIFQANDGTTQLFPFAF